MMTGEKQKPLYRDGIKYIAAFTMLLNHISVIFLDKESFLGSLLTDIGYFTGITMIWMLVEGYTYTHSRKSYAQRLLFFAVLSELPFCLAFTKGKIISFYGWNMLFTLLVCFGIVHLMNQWQDSGKRNAILALLVLSTWNSDWGILAPIDTILFVQAGEDHEKQKMAWGKAVGLFGILNFLSVSDTYPIWKALLYTVGTVIAPLCAGICILYFYNGRTLKKGRIFSKWFFYIFYPGHLLILGLIRLLAGR